MNLLDKIVNILVTQTGVKYLSYFVYDHKLRIEVNLSTLNGREIKLRFIKKDIDEKACITKLIVVLLEMERGEAWKIKRLKIQD